MYSLKTVPKKIIDEKIYDVFSCDDAPFSLTLQVACCIVGPMS